MKRWYPGITLLLLLSLFLVTTVLHAAHSHGHGDDADHDGISKKCVICAAGPLFETSAITAFTCGPATLPAAAVVTQDAARRHFVPLTIADPRGPPLSLV